ncbi:MAG: hypothetical protein M3295_07955 [Chloroflexota bacterium]|nr:hypothetical protein [Chloroflexota bacterium]
MSNFLKAPRQLMQFLNGLLVSITITGDVFCKSTNVVQRLDTAQAQAFIQTYI